MLTAKKTPFSCTELTDMFLPEMTVYHVCLLHVTRVTASLLSVNTAPCWDS
jgi:hypothetical protein